MYDFLIVGAGFSGAVLAERLANRLNKKILIVEIREHIGGNAYDYYNDEGILIHKYGPHWFHTNNKRVFDYLSNFTEWHFHKHIVKTSDNGVLFPFPINRDTLNKFFGTRLRTENDVRKFIENERQKFTNPKNAEEMVLSLVGKRLYEKFYKNYTLKQWNLHPKMLSKSITARIPVRFNAENSYFNDKIQAMPKYGYTVLFDNLLANPNIDIFLNKDFFECKNEIRFDKLIYTGAIDEYFNFCYGKLDYRTLRFEHFDIKKEYYQSCQQINFPNENKFTSIIEWKHATGQKAQNTAIMKEYPEDYKEGKEKYYPILSEKNKKIAEKYLLKTKRMKNIYFTGRLAEYKYYNMDQVIARALKLFEMLAGK